MTKVTVRFSDYHTGTPLQEIDIDSCAKISDLRLAIDKGLAADETSFLKVFDTWYTEVAIDGSERRFVQILPSDEDNSIESMGIVDFSVVYLDGPTFEGAEEENLDSLKRALSIANANWHHIFQTYQKRTALEIQQMKDIFAAEIAQAKLEIDKLSALVAPAIASVDMATEKERREQEAAQAAKEIMAKHPNMPMKALWEALNIEKDRKAENVLIPMAIINHPNCGLERKSQRMDGDMKSFKGGKVITFGATPIILASHAGRSDVVRALVAAGANVNAESDDILYSALHCAAFVGTMPCIVSLLGKGARTDLIDLNGRTPLHIAAYRNNVEVVNALIDSGSNFTLSDKLGRTAVHIAATTGALDAIKVLVARGLDMNAKDMNESTPLHLAAYCGVRLEALQYMVENGATVASINKNGNTPLKMFQSYQLRSKTAVKDADKILELLKVPEGGEVPKAALLPVGPKTAATIGSTTTTTTPPSAATSKTVTATPQATASSTGASAKATSVAASKAPASAAASSSTAVKPAAKPSSPPANAGPKASPQAANHGVAAKPPPVAANKAAPAPPSPAPVPITKRFPWPFGSK